MKILVDTGVVLIAVALSLVCTHTLVGIREGTVISAIVIGKIVHLIQPHIQPNSPLLLYPLTTPAACEEELAEPKGGRNSYGGTMAHDVPRCQQLRVSGGRGERQERAVHQLRPPPGSRTGEARPFL